jgi:hypothetical protein
MARLPVFATLASVALGLAPVAATGDRAPVTIPLVSQIPPIESFLGGGSPDGQLRIDDFRQRQPSDGAAVSQES